MEEQEVRLDIEWANSVSINGILEYKPQIQEIPTKTGKTVRKMTMYLAQPNSYYKKVFRVVTYSEKIMATISKIEKQVLINCVGQIVLKSNSKYYCEEIKVENIKITNFFKFKLKERKKDEQESN